jgi:ribosomal-protein-serine acetyltransferase
VDVLPGLIEGEGLVLRCWTVADAAAMHDAVTASLEHLRPRMPWIRFEPLSRADREALIAGFERDRLAGGDVILGIWRGGTVVGGAGLHRRIGDGGLEIGYWVHIDHVGEGIATTATRLLTDVAVRQPGIDRVEIRHDVTNAASERIPEKLGYAPVGEVTSTLDLAPADTGTDRVWRTTPRTWTVGSAPAS